jgi:hypothetical protein
LCDEDIKKIRIGQGRRSLDRKERFPNMRADNEWSEIKHRTSSGCKTEVAHKTTSVARVEDPSNTLC